jgi:hypothetical protein
MMAVCTHFVSQVHQSVYRERQGVMRNVVIKSSGPLDFLSRMWRAALKENHRTPRLGGVRAGARGDEDRRLGGGGSITCTLHDLLIK